MTNFANRYIALVNELASIDDPLIRGRQTTELLQTIKKMGPFVTDMRKRSIKELSDAGATFDEIGDMLGGLTSAPVASRTATDRRGASLVARERTVKEAIEEYIAHRRESTAAPLAANTVVGYKASLNNVICHSAANLGAAPVSALRARGIESWINDLSRAAVKRPTIRAAQRLLSASLTWEMRQGHLATNPASLVRHEHSKFSRGADQGDVVLLPTWKELATMVGQPQFEEDRPKAGINGHVPLPRLLWDRLVKLANQRQRERAMPAPAGKMLFRVPDQIRRDGSGTMDNKTWTRGVWTGCRIASGLNGDENRPATDPRRKPVKIKDLRAFTASMLHDAGATMTEASLMLRHSGPAVTQKHYLRAATDAPHDPARPSTALRGEALTVQERIDKMWEMWLTAFPTMATKLGLPGGNSSENSSARRNLRSEK